MDDSVLIVAITRISKKFSSMFVPQSFSHHSTFPSSVLVAEEAENTAMMLLY
jgi:hypothetical protein